MSNFEFSYILFFLRRTPWIIKASGPTRPDLTCLFPYILSPNPVTSIQWDSGKLALEKQKALIYSICYFLWPISIADSKLPRVWQPSHNISECVTIDSCKPVQEVSIMPRFPPHKYGLASFLVFIFHCLSSDFHLSSTPSSQDHCNKASYPVFSYLTVLSSVHLIKHDQIYFLKFRFDHVSLLLSSFSGSPIIRRVKMWISDLVYKLLPGLARTFHVASSPSIAPRLPGRTQCFPTTRNLSLFCAFVHAAPLPGSCFFLFSTWQTPTHTSTYWSFVQTLNKVSLPWGHLKDVFCGDLLNS